MYFFYYYPIGVDVPRPRLPWLSAVLVLSMAAVFVASRSYSWTPDFDWTPWIYRPARVDLLTPLTAVFLHGSWAHLLGNLVYLAVFAPALEKAVGRSGLLIVFVGTGYLGNLCQGALVLHTAPDLAWAGVVGASGAISGLLGFFLCRFPYAGIRLAYWAFLPLQGVNRTGVVRLPAVFGVILWLLLQLVLFWVQGPGGGTAYGAHLGGLAVGVTLALTLRMPARAKLDRLLYEAARRRQQGNFHAAVGSLRRYLELAPGDRAVRLDYARSLQMAGDTGRALAIYREEVAERVRDRLIEDACELYLEARRANRVFHLPPPEQKKLAFWLEKRSQPAEAAQAYLDLAHFAPPGSGIEHAMARAATLLASQVGARAEALDLLQETIRRFPDGPLRPLLEEELQRLGSSPAV